MPLSKTTATRSVALRSARRKAHRRCLLAHVRSDGDGGWWSGGFMPDCRIDAMVRFGTQQQWFTRNSHIGAWQGSNWNVMFAGVDGAPPTSFPEPPYTSLPAVPVVREKPFLHVTRAREWAVIVPAVRRDTRGTSWAEGAPVGTSIPLSRFLIAHPDTPVSTINAALAAGKHLLLTPGIYRMQEPLRIEHADTVVLGLGLATLLAERGSAAIVVADVSDVAIAGLLIDAGPVERPCSSRSAPGPPSAITAATRPCSPTSSSALAARPSARRRPALRSTATT
jgi:hypothetical protein